MGPYQQDKARFQVADGADGLQIWRVAANIEKAVADSWQRVIFQLYFGPDSITGHRGKFTYQDTY